MYLAHAFVASTAPWNRPGASELPVSATTPIRISVGEIPTSDAVRAAPPEPPLCPAAVPAANAAISAAAQTTAIHRNRLTSSPLGLRTAGTTALLRPCWRWRGAF